MSDQHDTPIKTPKQLLTIVILAFVIPISLIGFLVAYVTGGKQGVSAETAQKPQNVAERIMPVAALNLKDANAPKVFQTGEQVFKGLCISCHGTPGIATAPKMGDNAAWAPLIKEGLAAITNDAIKGTAKGMPPRGGNPDLDDHEIALAIVYMANGSGGKFKEPAMPAAAAGAAGAAGAAPAAAAAATAASAMAPAAAAPGGATAAASSANAFPAKVLFASGASAIDADGKKAIDAATAWLKGNAAAKVTISGYVDSTGNAAKNAELAKVRAFAVRDALKAAGIAEDRVALKKPVEIKGGDSAEARRVEVNLADAAAK